MTPSLNNLAGGEVRPDASNTNVIWTPLDNPQRQVWARKALIGWHELTLCRGNRGRDVLLESNDGTTLQWVKPEQITAGRPA